jgi:hypothetical protein
MKKSIGAADCGLGLRQHPPGEAFGVGVFEARRIDDREGQVGKARLALPPVARDTRPVVDQRLTPSDQPVEKRGLADVRAPDDCDGEAHDLCMPRFRRA